MTKYPKNSYITLGHMRCKVLGVLDDLRFLTINEEKNEPNWETNCSTGIYHIAELERGGWEEEAWIPEYDESYWAFSKDGVIKFCWTDNIADNALKDQGSVFRTQAEAEEARLKEYPNMDNAKTVKYADKEHWVEVAKNEEKMKEFEEWVDDTDFTLFDIENLSKEKVRELFGK